LAIDNPQENRGTNGYCGVIFFYSNEGNAQEPLHIHVRKGEAVAKFWLEPQICLAESYAMSSAELRMLMKVVESNKDLIERYWHEHFGI
jgi:hypothetical protein